MPLDWLRLPILAISILSLNRAQARAQEVLYLEAADWIPTASVLTMPTSCMAAGAYVFPTSYAVPTDYATAYLTESAPVTPTTYLAPSYYYPTTFRSSAILDAAVVPTLYARTTSTRCCGEVVDTPIVSDLPTSSEPARSTVAASPAARSNRREQSNSAVTPSAPTAAKPAVQRQGVADLDTVPDPAAELKTTTRPVPPASAAPAPGAEVPRPVAPREGEELQPAPDQTAPGTSGRRRTRKGPC